MRNAEIRKAVAAALAARKDLLTREIREKVAESRELDSESAPEKYATGSTPRRARYSPKSIARRPNATSSSSR